MTIRIELVEQESCPVLSVRTITNMANLPRVIGENYMKIAAYLSELGEQAADAPFTAYYNLDMENLDVEMGFPVNSVLPGKEDIQSSEIPAGKTVTAMYKGPYAQMEQPYNQMFKWIEENGYQSTGVYYEHYYNSPADVPESELLTKIVMPIR